MAHAAAIGAASQLARFSFAAEPATGGAGPATQDADLHWLEARTHATASGVTWGVPWSRGACKADADFKLSSGDRHVPLQSWVLATWPDGSLKWSAHAIGPQASPAESYRLSVGSAPPMSFANCHVNEGGDTIEIDTGVLQCKLSRSGEALIESIARNGRVTLKSGKLVCLTQDQPADEHKITIGTSISRIDRIKVEQSGPVRVVVRLEGTHKGAGRDWLPFVVRLYFYAGADTIRALHTIIYDGDEHKDFIRGLGVRFDVPMTDAMHDRHVRFVGTDHGLFAEAVRPITGQRRDPGRSVRDAQTAGEPTPPLSEWAEAVRDRLELIPAWGDFTLAQLSADGFAIRKRTKEGYGWIDAAAGTRAGGTGYVGGISGGVAFGLRDFWQKHPAQLDIRNAQTDTAQVTMWLWSPDAPPMDLRFYHDGMGMDTHPEELEGLNITYEDYEKGFGAPHGVARTSELCLWITDKTPPREATVHFADDVRTPPLLVCAPQRFVDAGVFGKGLFDLPQRDTPARANIEDTLAFGIEAYQHHVEQHHWYGFWHYGDVRHSYDNDRHVWRYDVGGYAWDNSELSPDLWLWYTFLRTGRADVFRMAEAMTRHTGEVDVYHLGRFAMLGTRHGVQHWSDSAKQLRISTAIYRRFFYYLTADERTGDLMRELVDADKTFINLDPIRKIREEPYEPQPRALAVGFGTDFSALSAAWFTEYERTGDEKIKEKLLNALTTIGQQKFGYFTSGALFDPQTGRFTVPDDPGYGVSHLSAVFGLVEINAELLQNFDVPGFEQAWLDYCEYYNADRDVRRAALGVDFRTSSLTSAHARLTAFAAEKRRKPELAQRAWDEFFADDRRWAPKRYVREFEKVEGPDSLNPIVESQWQGTNDAAQWSLAAMQCLALVGDALPANDPRTEPGQGNDDDA